jgi:uncharacterized membrane protein YdjX (TVP38/TMEM64 family)
MIRIVTTIAILLVVGGSLLIGWQLDFGRLLNPAHLADLLQSLGPWGPLILIVSMATAVVIPPVPSLPLDLAAGAAFGPFFGALYAVVGAAVGAIASFLIGRSLGRDLVFKLLRVDAVFCETCADHHVGLFIFLARLIPVFSFDVISYGAGLTTISLRTFSLATIAGMIPPTLAFTYLGSSAASAQWLMIGSACVLTAIFILTPSWLKRHRTSWLGRRLFGLVPGGMMVGPETSDVSQVLNAPIATRPSGPGPEICPACGGIVMPLIVSTKPAAALFPPSRERLAEKFIGSAP